MDWNTTFEVRTGGRGRETELEGEGSGFEDTVRSLVQPEIMNLTVFKSFATLLSVILSAMLILTSGCDTSGDNDDSDEDTLISRSGERESHREGANCMNCHRIDGDGEGVFRVAGNGWLMLNVHTP